MEAAVEKEKKEIKRQFEKEKKKIQQQAEMAEEDKKRLMDELQKKEEVQQKEKSKKSKLVKKIKGMEEKLLKGSEAMAKAMQQEQDLIKTKAALEDRRREQIRKAQEIKEKEEQTVTLQTYFTSQQEELDAKTQDIDKLTIRYGQTKSELDDMQEIIHREREDLMERIRELTREIRLKHLIID